MDIKKKFDAMQFNKDFEAVKAETKQINDEKINKRLNDLNYQDKVIKIKDLSMTNIFIGIKDSWFELLDELLDHNFSITTFTKNNRLFYLGITIFIIASLLYLYIMIMPTNSINSPSNFSQGGLPEYKPIYPRGIYQYDMMQNK